MAKHPANANRVASPDFNSQFHPQSTSVSLYQVLIRVYLFILYLLTEKTDLRRTGGQSLNLLL